MQYNYAVNLDYLNSSLTRMILAVRDFSRVLEVGCATGYVGEALAQKGCTVFGIEYDPHMAEQARQRNCYKSVVTLDLNQPEQLDAFRIEPVDHILWGDVIEHLLHPQMSVRGVLPILQEDGTMIFSIPNVSHGSLKLNLLLNNFRYTPQGLLDNTHIRFFTIKSVISFMTDLGLEIISLDRIFHPINLREQPVEVSTFPAEVFDFVRRDLESYSYQYVVTARRSKLSEENLVLQNNTFTYPTKQDYLNCQQYCQAFL